MKQPLTIRLSPEARKALEQLAQRDSRSLSSMVEALVKREAIQHGINVIPPLKAVAAKS